MSSFEHRSLQSSVADGFYDFVSMFADPGDDQCLVPGCANYSVLGCGFGSDCKAPRRMKQSEGFIHSAPMGPSPFSEGCNVPMPAAVLHARPPAMTPYGPSPLVIGSSSSRRGVSVPCCGSSQEQGRSREAIYTPAQTPYGPAPASDERQERRASSQAAYSRNTTSASGSANDAIDQQVQQFVRSHPRLRGRVVWKSCGLYLFDGREIVVEWQHSGGMAGPSSGVLIVTDGPLRQPLSDYVENVHASAVYNSASLRRSNLEQTSKEMRMTFKDDADRYSRLDAMKVAKEQANFREKAAEYSRSGCTVPSDLLEKYEKSMDIKLGRQHMSKKFTSKADQQRANAGLQNHVPSFRAGGSHAEPSHHAPEPQISSTPNVPSFSLFGTPSLSLNTLKSPEPNLFGASNFLQNCHRAGLQPPPGLKLVESNSQSRLEFGFQPLSRRGVPGLGGA